MCTIMPGTIWQYKDQFSFLVNFVELKKKINLLWLYMPIISATQEAEAGEGQVPGHPGQSW
jgi:hypothetical protein